MCGIVWVMRKDNKPAAKQVLKRYKAQKARGQEGFGYVGIKQSGRVTDLHRFSFEHEATAKLESTKHSTILFHHRYPTSTPNVPESAHPIKVSHDELQYDYLVTHNGVLNNEDELKEKHEKLGYKYTTELAYTFRTRKGQVYQDGTAFNDSEALAIELARNIEGRTKKTDAKGSIAYIVLQVEKQSQRAIALYFGTNGGNALTMEDNKTFMSIASQGGKPINDNVCYRMSLPDGTTTEYLQVQLHPVYEYKKAAGYAANAATAQGSIPWGRWHTPTKPTDDDLDLVALEDEIQAIDEEIIGVQGDITFAESEGELQESEIYAEDLRELVERREKLDNLYARKTNATA